MKPILVGLLSSFIFFATSSHAFNLITLGSKGGIQDGNLTAFLIKEKNASHYLALDAGTLVNGLIVANQKNAFHWLKVPDDSELTVEGYVLQEHIKGYFISHPHLDHIAGMIISSPDDTKKPIYGLKQTNEAIAANYFNWSAWPNFGNKGAGFKIGQYEYQDLSPYQWHKIAQTQLEIMLMPLSHSGTLSSAALIKNSNNDVFAYFGDTGPDKVEKTDLLHKAWQQLAPFINDKKLKGMIIEVSYLNERPDDKLFGHLTPNWLIQELSQLESLTGKSALNALPVIISHIKYSLKKADPSIQIKEELNAANTLGVNFIYPEQGDSFSF